MWDKLDLYKFKKALFYNGNLKYSLLFIWNFQITLEATGALNSSASIKYICTLLRVKSLHHTANLSVKLGNTNTTHFKLILLDLGTYIFPFNEVSKNKKQKLMPCGMRKPRKLKVRRYADRMININEYLDIFPGEKSWGNNWDRIEWNFFEQYTKWLEQASLHALFYYGYIT